MSLNKILPICSLLIAVFAATLAAQTPAAIPTFSVPAGAYSTIQSVTISDATPGAVIYYTTNGVVPTTASTVYSGPISIAYSVVTLRAIAAVSGGTASSVLTAVYDINAAAAPTFSLPAGTYSTKQTVSITDSTPGAVIHYTTNGFGPTTSSPVYSGPITITATTTLQALALVPNGLNSLHTSAVYTISANTPPPASAATPTFSVPAGTYSTIQTVTISDSTPGAVIYYTTNGVAPTTSSTVYTGPVTISSPTETLRAIAAVSGGTASANFTAVYTIVPAATPTFSVPAGSYMTIQTVAIGDSTPGATIYYTTTGAAPTTASTVYTGPITVSSPVVTLRAMAIIPNGVASANLTAVYDINSAALPTFSPAAGTYTGIQTVSILDSTAGAAIYYTTNGVAPTTSSTRYTAPLSVGGNMKLRAIAVYPGGPSSYTSTAIYTIIQSPAPVTTPNATAAFFGMDINHLVNGTPWPTIPVGSIRLWNTSTLWENLNPTATSYSWTNLDSQISSAKASDATLLYTFGGVPPWALPTNIAIQSIARSSGRVTVTTTAPHGLYYNPQQPATQQIHFTVGGVSDSSYNGSFYLTGAPSATTLTYAQTGANSSSSAGTVSANCSGSYAPGGCAEPPASLAEWDQFVTALINHVGPGAIKYWELWNEPNISSFWKGNPAMLVSMAQDARRIIKAVDPNAIILSPGITGNYETEVECTGDPSYCGSAWLSNWFSLGGAATIDGVAFHGYPAIGEAPEQIQGAVDLISSTMSQAGVGSLPIIDAESSWGANTNLPALADQTAWVARHLILEQSMGVQSTYWYAYDATDTGTLWTSSTGLNPTGEAYAQVEKWLTGATLTQPCAQLPTDATTFVCSYTRPNGYSAEAIWNTTSTESVAVSSTFVQYHDLTGAINPVSGGTVEISTTPILLENTSAF